MASPSAQDTTATLAPPAVTDGSDVLVSEGDSDTDTTPTFPSSTPASTIYKINSEGLLSKTLSITSPTQSKEPDSPNLYTCNLHSISRPHVVLTSTGGSDGSSKEVGSITFHPFSRHITVQINGTELTITHSHVFKSGYEYESPALGGEKVEWQGGSTSVLVDGKGMAMARMNMVRMAAWKEKSVEILRGAAGAAGQADYGAEGQANDGAEGQGKKRMVDEEKFKEEVLMTAIAIMELRRRRSRNSAGGGAGAP